MIRRFFLLLLLPFAAVAQNTSPPIVSITTSNVMAGRRPMVSLSVNVKEGYHIQAQEVSHADIIATTLSIDTNSGFEIKKVLFPPPKKFKLEGTDTYLDVYDGKFDVLTFLKKKKKRLPRGVYTLHGKLYYQACDSARCLFPRTVEFTVEIPTR